LIELHRAVHRDRARCRFVHPGQQALRLAEAVAQQQAGAAGGGVGLPPGLTSAITSACGRQR
jgi:hypothetical protein